MSSHRQVRVAVLGASPCERCVAACCKQNGHEFAALLQGDDEVRRFGAFSTEATFRDAAEGHPRVERVLPYVDGRCRFLGPDDRCTIYEDRPRACRRFECAPHFAENGPGNHGVFLQRNPYVRELLESL